MTGQALSESDLVPLQSDAGPTDSHVVPAFGALPQSIPAALEGLSRAFAQQSAELAARDAQIASLSAQLATALYQQEAAIRVIARLQKAIDSGSSAMEIGEAEPAGSGALDEAVVTALDEWNAGAQAERKKRSKGGFSKPATMAKYVEVGSVSAVPTETESATALAGCGSNDALLAVGTSAGTVALVDRTTTSVRSVLPAPTAGAPSLVTGVSFIGESPVASFASGAVALWREETPTTIVAPTPGPLGLAGLSVHPSASWLITYAETGSWTLVDVERTTSLVSVPASRDPLAAGDVHPDGLLVATADSAATSIWDVRKASGNAVPDVSLGTDGATAVAFARNGYHLFTASLSGALELWDLRSTSQVSSCAVPGGGVAASLAVDPSSKVVLASHGASLSLIEAKSKGTQLKVLSTSSQEGETSLAGVVVAPDGSWFGSVAEGGTVRLFSHA